MCTTKILQEIQAYTERQLKCSYVLSCDADKYTLVSVYHDLNSRVAETVAIH